MLRTIALARVAALGANLTVLYQSLADFLFRPYQSSLDPLFQNCRCRFNQSLVDTLALGPLIVVHAGIKNQF